MYHIMHSPDLRIKPNIILKNGSKKYRTYLYNTWTLVSVNAEQTKAKILQHIILGFGLDQENQSTTLVSQNKPK